jgi:hypothetical protein
MSHLMSLSGAKRPCPFALHMSAYDPKRTLEQLVQSQNRTVTPNIGPLHCHVEFIMRKTAAL